MDLLPFLPSDRSLKESIGLNFIVPASRWLMLGDAQSVLATLGNSSWEAAFSVIFLLDTKALLASESWAEKVADRGELMAQIDAKVLATVDWLLQQVQIDASQGESQVSAANWDGLTWDTSVVLRAILRVIDHYDQGELRFSKDIERVFSSALTWLIKEFYEWLDTPFTVGPQDVAEILILVTNLARTSPPLYQSIVGNSDWQGREEDLSWDIAELLIKTRTEAREFPIAAGTDEQTFALWWDEFFGTAEVLEALAEFYKLHIDAVQDLTRNKRLLFDAIEKTLETAILYFNYTQKGGTWGSAVTDTARVAATYMELTSLLPSQSPNAFIALKSLRWLCARTQVMKDGSFLHSLFLTLYYGIALMAFYRNWNLADGSVLEAYDHALHEAEPTFRLNM